MRRFRDLEILGPTKVLRDLIAALPATLPENWRRDAEAEGGFAEVAGPDVEGFAFARTADGVAPATGILLMLEGDRLRVSNIVPLESGQISIRQYNAVLEEFAGLLGPELGRREALRLEMTGDEVAITEWVSPEAAKLLQSFSVLANMSTGSSHPSDFARWAAFIIRVHKDGSRLDPDNLQRWLVEVLDWPQEKADELALEYEFARAILEAYDRTPA